MVAPRRHGRKGLYADLWPGGLLIWGLMTAWPKSGHLGAWPERVACRAIARWPINVGAHDGVAEGGAPRCMARWPINVGAHDGVAEGGAPRCMARWPTNVVAQFTWWPNS